MTTYLNDISQFQYWRLEGVLMPLKEIECPDCGTIVKKKVCDSLSINENPKSLKEIMEGKFNYSFCPKCKTKIEHKSHILLTYLDPPRWVWLVSKTFQNPGYEDNFFKNVIPPTSTEFIDQEMVFVDFSEPCNCLNFVLNRKMPQNFDYWVGLGKLYTGEKAINCYKNALKLNFQDREAKQLLNQEYDKLKSYSS